MALAYLLIARDRPADIFWSPDQGGKFLQVLALLEGRHDLSIGYPGRWLDPELAFRPYGLSYVRDGAIQMPWPMAWALPSSLLYAALGPPGLVVLPLAGGLLAAWAAGRLAERMAPGSGWLAILLTGLATPLFVFSTLFWEHAPTAGLFTAGLLLALHSRTLAPGLLAGCCFGLALAWRNETLLYLAAAALAGWLAAGRALCWRHVARLGAGLSLFVVPAATYNWLTTGAVYARTDRVTGTTERALENLTRYGPGAPADFLVGMTQYGLELPDALRWAPAAGLALLSLAWLARPPRPRPLRLVGLALAGSATAALFITPPPLFIHGFLIGAPFLALGLLAPRALVSAGTGRFLALFGLLVLPLYVGAALVLWGRGLAGGAEWGARFLLPVYPPLAALAAAVLAQLRHERQRPEYALGALLAALGLAFQLAGLTLIDLALPETRESARMITSLSPGPVVLRPPVLAQLAPELAGARALFCVESPAGLKRWTELALGSGQGEFWFVDWQPLQEAWLRPEAAPPPILDEASTEQLHAIRYETAALSTALRGEGQAGATCGYSVGG